MAPGIELFPLIASPTRLTIELMAWLPSRRRDGQEFLALAPRVPERTEIQTFPLIEANEALARLRTGIIQGAAVLVMD